MDKARVKAILDEHVGPMLTMDDGRGVMQAQQRQGEVLVSRDLSFNLLFVSLFICFAH